MHQGRSKRHSWMFWGIRFQIKRSVSRLHDACFLIFICHTVEVTSSSGIPPVSGVLGLGPNSGSRIHASLDNQPQGDAVLDRIFQQNVSTPNILTILLGRSNDPAETYPGSITVGEYLQGFENITSQPREPVTALPPDSPDQHWQVLLDEDGIIGPDGQPIQVQTRVQGTQNPKQLTAIFDTGFSFPQVPQCVDSVFSLTCIVLTIAIPREVSSAIYSGIPGASLQSVEGLGPIWLIPCDAEINIAFKFGGQTYPIHPLDTNSDDALTKPDGQVCLGAVCQVCGCYRHSLSTYSSSNPSPPARPHITTSFSGLLSVSGLCASYRGLCLCPLIASPERISPYQLRRFCRWQHEHYR